MENATLKLAELNTSASRETYRKITFKIIPFLFVCYVINFLDRINISFANLTMKSELGFTETIYGLAAGAFAIGYVLFEVPSNLILERIGARKTFCRIMVLWGFASASLMFVRHAPEFYAIRFVIGCFEAGFFPGIVLYLTYWYPQSRRAGVLSWFFAGVAIAGVVGGLVSGFIMQSMNGLFGLSGWQWMFVVEGLPAVVMGIAAYFYLSDSPKAVSWLTSIEKQQVAKDLVDDSTLDQHQHSHSFRAALGDWRVYALSVVYFCLVCGSFVISFWLPAIIKESGVKDVLHVSLYSAIPYTIGIFGIIGISRHSDKRGERRWHYGICSIVGAVAIYGMTLKGLSLPMLLGVASIAVFLVFAAIPLFWTLPTTFLHGAAAAGGVALISSIGMVGGFVSPYLIGFLKDKTGNLGSGIYVMASLLALSGLLVFMIIPASKASNRLSIRQPGSDQVGVEAS